MNDLEIKIRYSFTNHAPIILTLLDVQHGMLLNILNNPEGDVGRVTRKDMFIGLQDADNNDIYEGDLIDTGFHGARGIVVFEKGCYGIKITETTSKYIKVDEFCPLFEFLQSNLVIIKK